MTWTWRVTSPLGVVRGTSDEPCRAADWVELFLTRTCGHAEGVITGPGLDGPVRIASRDGVLRQKTDRERH